MIDGGDHMTDKRKNQYLAEATGKTVKQIARDTERDYFLTAEEAVAYGLADAVI